MARRVEREVERFLFQSRQRSTEWSEDFCLGYRRSCETGRVVLVGNEALDTVAEETPEVRRSKREIVAAVLTHCKPQRASGGIGLTFRTSVKCDILGTGREQRAS